MQIKDIYNQKKPVLSFEIFPPKPDYSLDTVFRTIESLKDLEPDFISVTYGAGGSNRARTIEIAAKVKQDYQIESVAHLTCVGHSPAELDAIIDNIHNHGIENILALRGDPPRDQPHYAPQRGYYKESIELVKHIKSKGGFCIGAAAYPEGHTSAISWKQDWLELRDKVAEGVDFMLTQMFFDNRLYYNFLENIRRIGITAPVSPGIMPVLNAKSIRRMISMSGASIPAKLLAMLEKYGDNDADFEKAGIQYAIDQINDLVHNGVDGIHLCTMNKVEQTRMIVENSALSTGKAKS
ncbi:TPA: methylenetetrahydrofolate reductase [NAD(P)H] [Candidatus Sumerlaeota bacterium]|jgi:methylenetetrahydrofolate reductase (NADPH)|nr:methylenetetrahydrofolate reductase [NAD(P)H] [Candidatus Sumerlaeota bacterium]